LSKEVVIDTMTNLFQLFAEQSTHGETFIKIKGVGTLKITKNKELIFQESN
jgi:hypothetical protein